MRSDNQLATKAGTTSLYYCMCGISGFNFKDEALARRMVDVLEHRGPDSSGIFCDDEISLGHDRLSIIDLSLLGAQPMKSNGGRFTIVFNGEIYNYRELREELKSSYKFKSQSDTEVILAAYEKWGTSAVNKFNGIFALAIWDTERKELFLARDHAGVKPLYYFYDGKRFIFASEVKAILEHKVPREVDREAFNFYFHLYYVPEPLTMFSGIRKLPAASYALLRGPYFSIHKYWEVADFKNLSSYDDAKRGILDLFNDSVKRQIISDRPVGVFLSGGIDSTAVLGAVSAATNSRVQTFSVGFDVKEQSEKFNADFDLARATAKHYGADHNELVISAADVRRNLEKIVWHLDEPNFNPTAAAIFSLSEMAKKQVAVVLGGDGGDELFGGYPRYYASAAISHFQTWPKILQKVILAALRVVGRNGVATKLRLPADASRVLEFLSEKQAALNNVFPSDLVGADTIAWHFTERYFKNIGTFVHDFEKLFMQIDRQSWLVDESLVRSDKMTMAHGLEERVPILDKRLIELAAKMPTAWKFNLTGSSLGSFRGKKIWRDAVAGYLPAHIVAEKKRGWFTPMAKWLRGDLRDYVSEILSPNALPREYFNATEAQRVWQDHLSGKRYNLNMIWAIVMWQLWYKEYLQKS